MADEKKVAEVKEEKKPAKKATAKKVEKVEEAPKKEAKPTKKEKKLEVKANTADKDRAKPTIADFGVIICPIITEKSMALIQNLNQATFKVRPDANKTNVKIAFERIFGVEATHVSISTVRAKETTRGGRYKGKIQGYKKAIVTIKEGEAIDLFKE